MQAPTTPHIQVRTLVVEVPVTQAGIIDVQQIDLPSTAARLVGVCVTNAVTDQPLRTNLRFQGTAAAGMAVSEANVETLARLVLDASFSYFDVPAPTAARPIYFAYPERLGAATFFDGPGAGAAAVAFSRRGMVNVVDTELSVSESFVLYEMATTTTTARRLYVRGLNLTGRPAPVPQAAQIVPVTNS